MGEHYSPEKIEEGLSGHLEGKRSKEIVRHLLQGCPQCQASAQQWRYGLITAAGSSGGDAAVPESALPP